MPKYTVRMAIYYEFKEVEADSEEKAKESITDYVWDENTRDVIFDVEEEKEDGV